MQRRRAAYLCLVGLWSLALLTGHSVLSSEPAWADCAALEPALLRDHADLVATGTVKDVTVHPMSSTVEIGVERVYKGTTTEETLVVTTTSGSEAVSSIDVRFEEGSRYLLYLREEGGEYTTSICSGTQPVGDSVPPELAASLEETTPGVSPALPETGGPAVPRPAALEGPALAGLQEVYSGVMASCAGGGFSVDLVAKGTVEDVAASRTSSRIEVRVEEVLLGERNYVGKTLSLASDSGTHEGNFLDIAFREGARYELYLQRDGEEWKTNMCLGTRELTEPSRTGSSVPGAPAGSPSIPETGGPGLLPVAVALGGVLVAVGVDVGWTGRRRG